MGSKWNPGCCGCGDECDCFCTGVPVSVTFAGATGCLAVLNATYGLTPSASVCCVFNFFEAVPTPPSPCVSGCPESAFPSRVWVLESINAGFGGNEVNNHVLANMETFWQLYILSGGICAKSGSRVRANVVFERDGCEAGAMVRTSTLLDDPALGSLPTSCSVAF